jgi:hypothetical protein
MKLVRHWRSSSAHGQQGWPGRAEEFRNQGRPARNSCRLCGPTSSGTTRKLRRYKPADAGSYLLNQRNIHLGAPRSLAQLRSAASDLRTSPACYRQPPAARRPPRPTLCATLLRFMMCRSASAAPVGRFAPRSSWDTYPGRDIQEACNYRLAHIRALAESPDFFGSEHNRSGGLVVTRPQYAHRGFYRRYSCSGGRLAPSPAALRRSVDQGPSSFFP